MSPAPDLLVVGAGIAGLFAALEARRAGIDRVRVIDRAGLAAGATGRSGALLRANYDNAEEARLALASLALFRDWPEQVGGNCGFVPAGLVEIAGAGEAAEARALAERQRGWGVAVEEIDPAFAADLVPRLRLGEPDGPILFQPDAGYADAAAAAASLLGACRNAGVEIAFGIEADALAVVDGRCLGVETAAGRMTAGATLVAAGARAGALLRPLGLDPGFVPHLSRVAAFRPYDLSLETVFPAVLDRPQEGWFRPLPGGGILVGAERGGVRGVDPAGAPESLAPEAVALYRTVLEGRFDLPAGTPSRGGWAGCFMISPDGRPVLGPTPVAGLHLAAGDSGGGFKIAPAVGRALAAAIAGGPAAAPEIAGLSIDRFASSALSGPAAPPARTVSR
ncbi:MAG: FAD-binding oxidoreductase [Azospirillaceae bacterium]